LSLAFEVRAQHPRRLLVLRHQPHQKISGSRIAILLVAGGGIGAKNSDDRLLSS
jgi:hypothetical protein